MSSTWGNRIKLSIFGESHGPAIGCVLDGVPAGIPIDENEVLAQMARRAPGNDATATPRKESDAPEVLSGIFNGVTTGAPIAAIIRNQNTRSADYAQLRRIPRPAHADYPASVRYGGHNDVRGGGHFSGRLTAPMVFAGAVCRQILKARGVEIGGHILQIETVRDAAFGDTVTADDCKRLSASAFPLLDPAVEPAMRAAVANARAVGDSVGGIVQVAATGLPAGLGNPMFGGVENVLASLLFGIPAVKGVSFGAGFDLASMRGSDANDGYRMVNGAVTPLTNHNGGILGGITTGAPLLFNAVIKPTPSIALTQPSVDLQTGENTDLAIQGRHDPCIVPRAVPVLEAACAIALLDIWEGTK